jgi:N-acyl-D-aspartate/D-glutamate deacylase
MRPVIIFVWALLIATTAFAEDLVLLNGTIIDGTLKARYVGNLRIREGEIAEIGAFKPMAGETVVDVKGLIVAPGFIDLRNYSEGDSQLAQGITTTVIGADGTGPYLVEEFMLPFDEKPGALNIASFVGHTTVRRQIMGTDYKRAATADEIQRMRELIEDGMRQGAFGFASNLSQEPASFSNTQELIDLAKSVGRFGGTYLIFPRTESIKEAIEIARTAKVQIHLALAKPAAAILAEIDRARTQGVDISLDSYSHLDAGQVLNSFLQHAWVITLPAQYARNEKAITLERAVRKMTGLPASRIGLRERGTLKKGAPADVVVFSPAPNRTMKYVFVNGMIVIKDGQPTEAKAGQALR